MQNQTVTQTVNLSEITQASKEGFLISTGATDYSN